MLALIVLSSVDCWYLRVSGKSNAGDGSNLGEELTDGVLVNVERQVTDEESIALGAEGVTVSLGAVGSTTLGVGISRASVGVVEVEGTAVELETLHGLVGLGAALRVVEVDVTETTAAASSLLSDNTSTDETIELLEGLVEGIVVDVPAQAASEESGGSISLGLLSIVRVDVILGLALLGGSLLSLLSLGIRLLLRVVAVIRILLGIFRVVRVVRGSSLLSLY